MVWWVDGLGQCVAVEVCRGAVVGWALASLPPAVVVAAPPSLACFPRSCACFARLLALLARLLALLACLLCFAYVACRCPASQRTLRDADSEDGRVRSVSLSARRSGSGALTPGFLPAGVSSPFLSLSLSKGGSGADTKVAPGSGSSRKGSMFVGSSKVCYRLSALGLAWYVCRAAHDVTSPTLVFLVLVGLSFLPFACGVAITAFRVWRGDHSAKRTTPCLVPAPAVSRLVLSPTCLVAPAAPSPPRLPVPAPRQCHAARLVG